MIVAGGAGFGLICCIGQADILGAYAFFALCDLEQHPVTFVQRPQPILHKTGIVDEDIRPLLAVNKTVCSY